jgi:hypothetical protein
MNNFIKPLISIAIVAIGVSAVVAVYYALVINRSKETAIFKKDAIQNHIVWSVKGECFFVNGYTESDYVKLIRVEDCDKKGNVQ